MNLDDFTNAIIAILDGEPFDLPKKLVYFTLRTAAFYERYKSAVAFYEKIKEDEAYHLSNLEKALTPSAEFYTEEEKMRMAAVYWNLL